MPIDRRTLMTGASMALLAATAARAGEPAADTTFAQDFDELLATLRDRYCFLSEKRTDLDRVRTLYRPMALAAPTVDAFTEVVRRVLAEFYDAHTHLSDPPDGSPRWPPFDLLVSGHADGAAIDAIRDASAASEAGLAIGDVVIAIGGRRTTEVAASLAPRCLTRPDPQATLYALNIAVAGRRGLPRTLLVRSTGAADRVVLLPVGKRPVPPDLESRRLDGNLGYIAIRSFADGDMASRFDAALLELRDTTGLIIDVRGNGGGDTAVARPIMGRFITATKPYATMRRRDGRGLGAFWIEQVEPVGPFTYGRPVVVLVDHWSGSMAEGFPMGMRAIAAATIVGTPMMGLGAAVFAIRLDRTGIAAQYSAEPVYDVTRQPRWLMRPDVAVSNGADIFAAGVAVLKSRS